MELSFSHQDYYDSSDHKVVEIHVFGNNTFLDSESIYTVNNKRFNLIKKNYFIYDNCIPEILVLFFELYNRESFDKVLKILSECKKAKYIFLVGNVDIDKKKISKDEINTIIKQYNIYEYFELDLFKDIEEELLLKEICFFLYGKYYNESTDWMIYETYNLMNKFSKNKNSLNEIISKFNNLYKEQKKENENKLSFEIFDLDENNIINEIDKKIKSKMDLLFLYGNIKSIINNIDPKIKNMFLISLYINILILEGKINSKPAQNLRCLEI